MPQQRVTGDREADRSGVAADAVDERAADERLQLPELLAHRGLHVAEPLGCPAKGALLMDRGERGQVPQLDAGECEAGHANHLTDTSTGCQRQRCQLMARETGSTLHWVPSPGEVSI